MKHFFCVALVFPLFAGCLAVADTNLPVAEILPDGTSVLVLKGHTDAVLDVAFSPDGKTIVSASADLTARIWDAETGKELKKLEGHLDLQVLKNVPSWLKNQKSAVNSVAFSPDGKKIATGGTDGILIIWDAESGKILQKIAGQPKNGTPRWVHDLPIVRSVVWSPDGSTIATASETVAHLWDADTGKGLHEWEHSYDMRDLNNMRDLKVRVYTRFYPNSIDISHDGKKILVAGGGAFRIWDTDSRKDLLAQLFDDGSRHGFDYSRFNFAVPEDDLRFSIEADISTIRSAVFSPDSKKIVTTSTINYWVSPTEGNRVINGSLRIFDGESGKELRYLKGQGGWDIAFSPDGKRFAVAGADGIIRIRDAETAEDLKKLEGHTGAVRGVAYSPDGKQIVSASEDKTVRIWNIELRKELANTDPIFKAIILEDGANSGFFNFSPDGKKIAAGATDGNTRIWDADTGKILQKFEGLIALRFLLDGKRILGLDRDVTAQILDVESKSLHKLEGKHAYLSPDEKRIATLGPNNTIQIWDTESGKKLWKLEGQEPSFSPDGQKIVTSCREGTRIWDVESGMELQNFEGWNSVFSPDGKIIVTAVPTDGFRGSIKIGMSSRAWSYKNLLDLLSPFPLTERKLLRIPGIEMSVFGTLNRGKNCTGWREVMHNFLLTER